MDVMFDIRRAVTPSRLYGPYSCGSTHCQVDTVQRQKMRISAGMWQAVHTLLAFHVSFWAKQKFNESPLEGTRFNRKKKKLMMRS